MMATINHNLDLLFNEVDDWFSALPLDEPVTKGDSTLDLLARDLEFLIENDHQQLNCNKTSTQHQDCEMSFFNIHHDDFIGLLDTTIGSCCTLETETKRECNTNRGSLREISVTLNTLDSNCMYPIKEDKLTKPILTPLPLDHDYLNRPRRSCRPFTTNKKLFVDQTKKKKDNILNVDALKSFAKMSEKIRVLINC